jgi:uncharacterized protein (TIGR02271 family)
MSKNNESEPVRDEEELAAGSDGEGAVSDSFAAVEGDSGEIETLPDGAISIPILEEELVITKRIVVRERIVVSKEVETETQRVEAELRRERVEIDEGDAPSAA